MLCARIIARLAVVLYGEEGRVGCAAGHFHKYRASDPMSVDSLLKLIIADVLVGLVALGLFVVGGEWSSCRRRLGGPWPCWDECV